MAVPVGIITRLRDVGVHSSFVIGENILNVNIHIDTEPHSVVSILAAIYEFDLLQSCKYVGQGANRFYQFEFRHR